MTVLKKVAIGVGGVIAFAHIGILGHLVSREEPTRHQPPVVHLPRGPYSSYKIQAGKDGYTIEYRADDPKVLESSKSLDLDKDKRGWFGGGSEKRRETRYDQYTREGVRNIGGATDGEGKSAKDVECLIADAGARSQGAMAGSAVATGVVVPAVMNVPYIGWLAAGWATLLGNNIGSEVGSQVGGVFNDC